MKQCVPTLLLVPNTLLWEGLARLLSTTSYKPLGCSASLNDLVQDVDFDPKRAMFIVGWDSGARAMSGSAALVELKQLRERYPEAKLIVMSAVCDFDSVVASLHAGADGYVLGSMTCEMLTKSFDLVMAGETILPAEFTRAFSAAKAAVPSLLPNQAPPTPKEALLSEVQNRPNEMREMRKLSGRELAIMSHLREGDSNKIIARRIGLAEATVKTHVKAILRKVGVKNRTQAALWAIANLEVATPDTDTDTDPLELQPEPPYQSNGGSNGAHVAELPPLRREEFTKLPRQVTRQRSRATADQ